MGNTLKPALVLAVALLLHVAIAAAHIRHNASKLQSGEWHKTDAEAIGGVWNINSSGVAAATQATRPVRPTAGQAAYLPRRLLRALYADWPHERYPTRGTS